MAAQSKLWSEVVSSGGLPEQRGTSEVQRKFDLLVSDLEKAVSAEEAERKFREFREIAELSNCFGSRRSLFATSELAKTFSADVG